MGKGTVKREVERLCGAGLLTLVRVGNQNHYQANPDNPIFLELKGIIQKTFGVVDVIKTALLPVAPQLELAFIYGSVAKGSEHAGSDIDVLLVVDDVGYGDVMALLAPARATIGTHY
jgi:uncharacterized protein